MDSKELEAMQKLENFRMEIKGIIERLAGTDPTLAGVKEVSDFQKEEMEVWEKMKIALKKLLDIVTDEEESKNVASFTAIAAAIREVVKSFDVRVENKNRKFFYNWLNNRLNILENYTQLMLDNPASMRGIVVEGLSGEATKIGMTY